MRSAAQETYRQRKEDVRYAEFTPDKVRQKHVNSTVSEITDDRLKVAKGSRTFDDESSRLEWWRGQLGEQSLFGQRILKTVGAN